MRSTFQGIRSMKPRRRIAALVLICLVLLWIGTDCDGSGYAKTIPAKAFPSGNVLEIDLRAKINPGTYVSVGANQFASDLTLLDLAQKIQCDNATFQYVADPVQGQIGVLVWVPCDDGTNDVYYLEKIPTDDQTSWYLFSGMGYQFYDDQLENSHGNGPDRALFPAFCLDVTTENVLELSYGVPYRCDSVTVDDHAWENLPQEVAAFYEATGDYDVELENSVLSVRAKDPASTQPELTLCFERAQEEIYLTILPSGTGEEGDCQD